MSERRQKLLNRLLSSAPSETEQKMLQLVLERVCADMCDHYERFYGALGPGALVYLPRAEEENSVFYMPVGALIDAKNDCEKEDQTEVADTMRKAITRAEALNPETEALFLVQDENYMSLIHYKRDQPLPDLGSGSALIL